jgi:hypothetical protein
MIPTTTGWSPWRVTADISQSGLAFVQCQRRSHRRAQSYGTEHMPAQKQLGNLCESSVLSTTSSEPGICLLTRMVHCTPQDQSQLQEMRAGSVWVVRQTVAARADHLGHPSGSQQPIFYAISEKNCTRYGIFGSKKEAESILGSGFVGRKSSKFQGRAMVECLNGKTPEN